MEIADLSQEFENMEIAALSQEFETQVPDELERVMVGLQSYLSIRARCNDISFSVFETDEGTSPAEKELNQKLLQIKETNNQKINIKGLIPRKDGRGSQICDG